VSGFEKKHVAPFRDDFKAYLANHRRATIEGLLSAIKGKPEMVHYTIVSYVMSDARQLIESLHDRDRLPYKWLRLYCHLCVHATLARDELIYNLLDEIATASAKAMTEGGDAVEAVLYRVIPSQLSPARLRNNLRALYEERGLPADFWDDDAMWARFVDNLIPLIVWKRIELPLDIAWEEIQRVGGLQCAGPPYEEPTKATEADPLNRRAMRYFRRMLEAVGFSAGVPISLQLAPVKYLHLHLKNGRTDDEFERMATETRLRESYPGDVCWLLEMPGGMLFAPFSVTGELPDLSIGRGKQVGIVIKTQFA
jgi:hypothetical protein